MRIRIVAMVALLVGIGALLAGCGRGTAPTISAQPKDQGICSNGSATFSVTAAGTAPLTYQWRKDGTAISGATNASYTISSVSATHAGSYTVVVTNKAGTVTSSAATLVVNAPPTVTTQPISQAACAGKSVLFTTSATGTAPLSYQWQKNGADIPGATTAMYTINGVVPADAGSYAVVVRNPCGSVTSSIAVLSMDVPPTIATQPESQIVCQGLPAALSVVAEPGTAVTYQWQKDGSDITGASAATYRIASAAIADAGMYLVKVTNGCGTTTSERADLIVTSPPTITLHPVSQTADAGSAVTLSVIATGTEPLAYKWSKDGVEIPAATSNLLAFPSAAAADGGSYTVLVENACGTATSNPARLAVTTPPTSVEPATPPVAEGPFMTVNGHPVSRAAFDDIRASILAYYTRLYAQFGIDIQVFLSGARGRVFQLELELSALTSLLTRGIVEAEAARREIVLSPEEIEAEFERQYQTMLDTYGITEEYLIGYFAEQGGTLHEFKDEGRASVAEQLLYEALQKAVSGQIEISESDLGQYFEDHRSDYGTDEQVKASHILVATRAEAEEVMQVLTSGEDFAALAGARSTCPSAAQGGDLGWFGRGAMVPAFEEAAFALEVGETSDIVETQFGFHIILLTDRREAVAPEFDEVADRVRTDAEKAVTSERFEAWLDQARGDAEVSVSDPLLHAMYLKDRNIDEGIAAFEALRNQGQVQEKYLSFIVGSLYEEKMALLESDKELLETQLPEGPEREAQIAIIDGAIEDARLAALAAYQQALKDLPDDEDVKERITALEGPGLIPR